MNEFILRSTPLSQWHELVQKAQGVRDLKLPEDLESYLVYLLMRFTEKTSLSESVLAIDFLEAQQAQPFSHKLQEVGDKCLLFSGLFPKRAEKKNVGEHYFVHIGQSAYHSAAHSNTTQPRLYQALAEEFLALMHTLRAMRHTNETIDLEWLYKANPELRH